MNHLPSNSATSHLPPYPAYKDSGLPWLGRIPAHWEVRRLRQVVEMLVSNIDKHTKEGEIPIRLCNYVDVYKNDRITAQIEFMRATATLDEIKRFQLHRDDVAITKDSETWNDIGVPALIDFEAPDLVYGYHLAILRPKSDQMKGSYLLRALQSQTVATQLHVAANGVTCFGLSHNAIKTILPPLPPLPEQRAIARYLDWADARIPVHPIPLPCKPRNPADDLKTLRPLWYTCHNPFIHDPYTGGPYG